MPVLVKDYEWEETETNVLIKVALKGIHSSKADVLTSSEYLKVNYRPFLFECFLHEKVDTAASSVQLKNGEVVFLLLKLTPGLWTKLQSDIVGDKAAMKLVRDKAIEESQKEAEEAKSKRAETKRLNEKYSLKKMMKIEDDMRERIHNIKEHEKQKATEEIEEWKANQKLLAEQEKAKLIKEKKALNKNTKTISKKKLPEKTKTKSDIFSDIPTRESGKIEVNFTPRVFPTPVRESQTPQEEEWLRKQAEATRIKEFMTKDLTEEEKNPLFLRDKGNKFFQDGNYLAAINIYTHAIQLDYKMPALYSNRAACHLKVKNYMKCIEDSSKALDLLLPPVPQNASSRCRAFVRRGTAFCKLELFVEGLQDYEAALKLDPSNEQLIKDAEEIRKVIQS
ncbi:dynein assembly factor 4, axonemal-like isoform X1 [Octopus sinensis]|uniref:Dynein assembly factor 4, axonemal-like isoform X1 n=1 Tax=Octopus sinensis TaxID=2607531 RepID=A0A6P7T6N0_9MOLL|nr:dynein assembly factor 4, axonemal-like isoform X1 [Octopus sinensis]